MELFCYVCGRANKIIYEESRNEMREVKEKRVKCAYCSAIVMTVEDYRRVYAIEWDDEYYYR